MDFCEAPRLQVSLSGKPGNTTNRTIPIGISRSSCNLKRCQAVKAVGWRNVIVHPRNHATVRDRSLACRANEEASDEK